MVKTLVCDMIEKTFKINTLNIFYGFLVMKSLIFKSVQEKCLFMLQLVPVQPCIFQFSQPLIPPPPLLKTSIYRQEK